MKDGYGKKKVLTKRITKKKKVFKDPFLRELDQPKVKKVQPLATPAPNPVKTDETFQSRTAANKVRVQRLLPKTRLQLPSHTLRSARTFAQCPSMSVMTNESVDNQKRQLPTVCSRGALNFHARRLGTSKRVDNEYRIGQNAKRMAGRMKIDVL